MTIRPNSHTANCPVCLDPVSLCVCLDTPSTKLAMHIINDAGAEPEHVSIGREAFITLCERAYAWGRQQSSALSETRPTRDEVLKVADDISKWADTKVIGPTKWKLKGWVRALKGNAAPQVRTGEAVIGQQTPARDGVTPSPAAVCVVELTPDLAVAVRDCLYAIGKVDLGHGMRDAVLDYYQRVASTPKAECVEVPQEHLRGIQWANGGYCPACGGWNANPKEDPKRGCTPKFHTKDCWLGQAVAPTPKGTENG